MSKCFVFFIIGLFWLQDTLQDNQRSNPKSFLSLNCEVLTNILHSFADQKGTDLGTQSIISGSHFHCLPLTEEKNLGPIKGWRSCQPAIWLRRYPLMPVWFGQAGFSLSSIWCFFSLSASFPSSFVLLVSVLLIQWHLTKTMASVTRQ